MEKNRKRKEIQIPRGTTTVLIRMAILGKSGAIYNLNTFTKTEKNKPRLTEQIGLLVLQLDLCNFVLLQLAPFISYSLSIIVL